MSEQSLFDLWYPTALAFAVVSGSINGQMTALKATVKNFHFAKSPVFLRFMPFFPNVLGMIIWPFVGPHVYPETLGGFIALDIGVGALAGSLSANIYSIWTNGIKRADGRVQEEIGSIGKPDATDTEDKPSELEPSVDAGSAALALAAEILDDSEPIDDDLDDIPDEEPSADVVDGESLDDSNEDE